MSIGVRVDHTNSAAKQLCEFDCERDFTLCDLEENLNRILHKYNKCHSHQSTLEQCEELISAGLALCFKVYEYGLSNEVCSFSDKIKYVRPHPTQYPKGGYVDGKCIKSCPTYEGVCISDLPRCKLEASTSTINYNHAVGCAHYMAMYMRQIHPVNFLIVEVIISWSKEVIVGLRKNVFSRLNTGRSMGSLTATHGRVRVVA